jgi:heptosyltransferase-2
LKILVRATNWLGDAVMSIPALREIRRAYAGAKIVVLARPWVADLYRREEFCDRILTYEHAGRHAGIGGKLRLAAELRRERFDEAVLLQNAFDAALLAWLARIPRRVGYDRDGRGLLLTDRVPVPERGSIPEHERFYYLELLRRAAIIPELPKCDEIRIGGAAAAAEAGREAWKRRGLEAERWIGVSPGAAYGGAKRWLPERFAEAACELSRQLDADIALFGSAAERDLCAAIAEKAGTRAHNLAGETSLREYIDLAAACTVYLTNDSGPMHIAAALGVPSVAVFGATNHITTGPSAHTTVVVRHAVECSPGLLRECPIDHPCMTGVTSGMVVSAAREALVRLTPGGAMRGDPLTG